MIIKKPDVREAMFNYLIEHCPVAMALLDMDMRYLVVSKKWLEDYELGDKDIIGRSHYDIFPDIPERWKNIHQQCLEGRTETCDEDPFIRNDGRTSWLKWKIEPWIKADGEIGGILMRTEEITKLKETRIGLDQKSHEVRERVKELSALYRISAIANKAGIGIEDIINECLQAIPPAYQFPPYTCVRISIDHRKFLSPGFIETPWRQQAIIVSNNQPAGTIEVFYLAEMPLEQEGPFLREERLLLNSISDILGNSIERIRAENEEAKINRLFKFISEINGCMLKAQSVDEIFKGACRIGVEKGLFRMAWIGLYDREQEKVVPYTWYGHEEGYLEKARIMATDKLATGRGPSGKAIRTLHYQYCNDVANDPMMAPWREEALKRDYRSSISIPLLVNHQLEAIYTLYMSEAFFFNESEIRLLLEVADNLAFALEKLRLLELQKEAEKKLKESEDKFRSLVEQTPAGVYIYQEGAFAYINPGIERITGYSLEELNRTDLSLHIQDLHRDGAITLQKFNKYKIKDKQQYHFQFIKKDGSVVYLELRNSMILYGGMFATIGTLFDITDRIEEEKHIERAVNDAQEKERTQIGMEMHDNVQQILVGSILTLEFAKSNLENKEQAGNILIKLEGYLREALTELRRLSHQLAPSLDSETDFRGKIEDMVNDMKAHAALQVTIEVPHFRKKIRDDIQLALYRILQEQFSNILKYAQAKNVLIRIERKDEKIHMVVRDDGIGFNPVRVKSGIGLENIRRRATVLDGRVKIISAPKKGCEINVEIPFAHPV